MKFLLVIAALPFVAASECGKKKKEKAAAETAQSIPACMQKIIEKKSSDMPPDVPERIDEYLFNGKTVYLLTASCCDRYNELYDLECNMICAPSGGFTGKGDGKCPEFAQTGKLIRNVWKKTQ